MSFTDLDATEDGVTPPARTYTADIVFVHGFRETGKEAWTDPGTGTLWMRDLFPYLETRVRRLIYEYDAASFIMPGVSASNGIYDEAVSLVRNLAAYRYTPDAERRPIVFVCHEFGGLLVKRALSFAHSRKSINQEHVRAVYLSTYAVIFLATPHHGLSKDSVLHWSSLLPGNPSMSMLSLWEGSPMLQEITDQFAPLLSQLVIHNYWERQPTRLGKEEYYVVDRSSASLAIADVQECAINATHSEMIKFKTRTSPGYRLVLIALTNAIKEAPAKVAGRWQHDADIIRKERTHDAELLLASYSASFGPQTHLSGASKSAATFHTSSTAKPPLGAGCDTDAHRFEAKHEATESINKHYLVRRLPEFYMGRKEQSKILYEKFWSGTRQTNDAPLIFVIYGLPGSGKSAFCLRYVEEHLRKYWGIFWVDCTTDATADNGFSSIGELAGKGSDPGSGRVWLSQASRPWLLVLDNANDPEMELSRYIPSSGNGHILITTRYSGTKLHSTVGYFEFHGMNPAEAGILLLKMVYPDKEAEDSTETNKRHADKIASELGYLALALKQAAHTIRQRIQPLERYLTSLLGCRKALLSQPMVKSAVDANIIATWELPFRDITSRSQKMKATGQAFINTSRSDTLSQSGAKEDDSGGSDKTVLSIQRNNYRDAVDLIRIFPFLHFQLIPCQLFNYSYDEIRRSSRDTGFPSAIEESNSRFELENRISAASKLLSDYSIVSLLDSNEQPHLPLWESLIRGRYLTLHPAIHQWARERLTAKQKARWLTRTTAILGHAISENMEASGQAFRRLLIPHIDVCRQLLVEAYPNIPTTQSQAWQLEKFGMVYAESGMWKTARSLQRSVVDFRVKTLGQNHQLTIRAKRNLANTNWNLFDVAQCIGLQYDVWKTQLWSRPSIYDWAVWPPWRPVYVDYCKTLDGLTQSLWLAGKRDLSLRTGKRAVDALTRKLGKDDPITLSAMFNLGRTYLHVNQHEKSERLLTHVLELREHYFGTEHPDTLMARNELGMNYFAQRKNLTESELMVRTVLVLRRRILGEEHAYTLWSVNDLSKVYIELNQLDEAISMLENIVPIVERTLGEKHAGMVMTKSNLALAYIRRGMLQKAKQEITFLRDNIPKGHPDWIHAEWAHALVLHRHDGDSQAAEKCCKDLLSYIAKTRVLELENPRVTATADILFEIYQESGRDDDAVELKKKYPKAGSNEAGQSIDHLPLSRTARGS